MAPRCCDVIYAHVFLLASPKLDCRLLIACLQQCYHFGGVLINVERFQYQVVAVLGLIDVNQGVLSSINYKDIRVCRLTDFTLEGKPVVVTDAT